MSFRLSLSALVLRLTIGAIFILHGYPKLATPAPFVHFFANHGIPGGAAMVTFVGVVEFIGGLLLVLGLLTRAGAFLLAVDMLVALFAVELKEGFQLGAQFVTILLAANVGLLVLGGGFLSLDQWVKKHRYILSRFFVITLLLFVPAAGLRAAGGGGGGSVPVAPLCTDDTWTCIDWGGCAASGEQKRTCTLTNDCASADTPKPMETRSCTPECISDVWQQTWSACSAAGTQKEVFTLTTDCPLTPNRQPDAQTRACTPPVPPSQPPVPTPEPPETPPPAPVAVPKRWCGNLKTMEARILCRLRLSDEELQKELDHQYLPEECRALQGNARKTCVQRYRAFHPCWAKPVGPERTQCANNVLFHDAALTYVAQCPQSCAPAVDRACCRTQKQQRQFVDLLVKFRLYDLSERAEETHGISKQIIARFVTTVERVKQQYNKTGTEEWNKTGLYNMKRERILEVRTAWKQFVARVRSLKKKVDGGTDDHLNDALQDIEIFRPR